MKKITSIICIFTIISSFTGCSNIESNNRDATSQTSVVSQNNSNDGQNKSETGAINVNKLISINIEVNNTKFKTTLEDNDTTKGFIRQMPLTVDMSELNGNEKYNYLPNNIRADNSKNPGKIDKGDLMLYGDNCLVLFYKSFNTSYNYVKLGHIDNTKGLNEALGSGNVKVTLSVSSDK
jgi:hypothetical protein